MATLTVGRKLGRTFKVVIEYSSVLNCVGRNVFEFAFFFLNDKTIKVKSSNQFYSMTCKTDWKQHQRIFVKTALCNNCKKIDCRKRYVGNNMHMSVKIVEYINLPETR